MNTVQAIIFDLGNVIIDIHPERTLHYYQQQGIPNVESIYQRMAAEGWFVRVETGEATVPELMDAFRAAAGVPVADEVLLAGWDALLGDLPAHRIQLLEQLVKHYPLFALSNTNQRHIEVIDAMMATRYGKSAIHLWFRKAYYSFETGYRKPQPVAYRMILEEQGLTAATTLMVDDLTENIEAARQLGMSTLLVQPGTLTEELFTTIGITVG